MKSSFPKRIKIAIIRPPFRLTDQSPHLLMRQLRRLFLLLGILVLACLLVLNQQGRQNLKLSPASPTVPTVVNDPPVESPATVVSPTLQPATEAFHQWAKAYAGETPERQLSMLTEGTRLANEHRASMKHLIQEAPRLALEQAIPMVIRQRLPEEITMLLEERINNEGFYGVLGIAEEGNQTRLGIRRIATIDEKRYEAHVYGRRETQRTTEQMNIVGVAVDGQLAIDESPLRQLEDGEKPDPKRKAIEICPISKRATPVDRAENGELPTISISSPAVEVGSQIYYLCHGGHIQAFADGLVAKEGQTGGASKPTGTIPSSWTTGPRRVLYIRATFPDQRTDPQTEKESYDMMRQTSDFMAENSYGKCYFVTTVTPLIVLPRTLDWYNLDNTDGSAGAVLTDARTAAREAGFDTSSYDLYAVRYNGPGSFSGQGYVGGAGVWLKSSSVGVAAHEFGHNLGLWHANYWNTGGKSTIGSGSNGEYGHSFDTMGSASAGNYHFNAQHRAALSWLPSTGSTKVTQSGVYRIYQIDQPLQDPAKRYALTFTKDVQRSYWCEFRQRWSSNAWMMNGLQVCWGPWGDGTTDNTSYGSNGGAQLLDMTPGSPDDKNDAPLVIGKTFSDRESGIHFTPLGKGGTVPESIDVQVNLGQFPSNQAPVISELTASNPTPAVNGSITLTATASDPDNDTLAYFWDFGDKSLASNQPSVTKSWTTAGNYFVRCEVSDMKGKLATKTIQITVGTTTTLIATGHVLDDQGQPLAGVRVSNGLTGTSYRGFISEMDGAYSIGNLTAGYTLVAALDGYSFTQSGGDFTGTPLVNVSISATDADAVEGNGVANEPGTFRLTRTGATTSALTVRVQLTGTASTGDYSLSPTATSNLTQYYFTIPIGQASLDVTLTPINDATQEGLETAIMNLVPATGYVTNGQTSALIGIRDTDSLLPVITMTAVDDQAGEDGNTGTILFRRSGDPTGALNVVISANASSTATNGTDYPTLQTTVTIPDQSSEATLVITPNNDTLAEGTETLVVSLSTNAAYLRNSTTLTATIQLVDDDLPTVSIAATDANAAEALSDPAIFTVTRTGPTTAALQVEYALSGTANHGSDYAALPGTLTIPAGQSSAPISIYPMEDAIGEPSQTVIVSLRSEGKYVIGTNTATATITDNDIPLIMLDVSDGDCAESANNGTFRVISQGTGTGNVTVNYTVTGTATSGTDFTALSGSVSVPKNGSSSANITISPIQDTLPEDAETVTITLTPDPSATPLYILEPESTASLLINDDDQPMVSVSTIAASTVTEGSAGTFYISRNGSTAAALTVNFTLSGNATASTDFTDPGTSVTIPAASVGTSLSIATLTDSAIEGTEAITLTINGSAGGHGARIPSATFYITDSLAASLTRTCRFTTNSSTVSEAAGVVNLPVSLSAAATAPVTVEYAISSSGATGGGVDYAFTPGTITFEAGETAKTIPVQLLDDPFIEGSETLAITLRNCLGAARLTSNTYTLTITSDDVSPEPYVSFVSSTSTVTEGPGVSASLQVNLTSPQGGPVSVDYAVTGGTATSADYTGGTGTVIFAAGETTKNILIPLVDDTDPESTESLIITLSNALGAGLSAPSTNTLSITDNDQIYVSIAATDTDASEDGPNPGTFTITRSGNLVPPIVVDLYPSGTATSGTDYATLPTTIALASGETTATVTMTPVDDTLNDANETVILSLTSGVTGGGNGSTNGSGNYLTTSPTSAQITIQDNENNPPTITLVSPVGGKARLLSSAMGLMLQTTVADDGRPSSPGALTLTWSKLSGPGTVTFESPNTAQSACTFDSGGEYVLRLTAYDGEFTTTQDISVTVEPVAWQSVDVGNATSRPGSFSESNGVFTITGAGSGTTANTTTDGHYLMFRPLSGDVEMIVRVINIPSGSNNGSRCGVMVRGSSASNAQHAVAAMTTDRSSFAYRLTTGGNSATNNTTVTAPVTPRWVRLVRKGNLFTAYAGTNGTTWTQQGTPQTIAMADPVLMGLSVTSVSTTASVTATFDNLQIITANNAPSINAGADGETPITSSYPLNATITDDAKPTPPAATTLAWSKLSGPGTVAFSSTSIVNPSATFNQPGNYVLRLQADDGQAITFDDIAITVTDPPTVTVAATVTETSEVDPTPAKFVITRSSVTTDPLTVSFSLTGSAANGVDYATTTAQVVIPASAGSAEILITPLADSLSEGDETAILTLTSNPAYILGSAAQASITIHDRPIDDWKQGAFGLNANDPQWSGDSADPDADGVENLTEYALNLNPTSTSTDGLPTHLAEPTELSLYYQENSHASDVTVTPVWSDGLSDWSSDGFSETLLNDNGMTRQMKAVLPVPTNATRKFIKLLITKP